MNNAEVVIFEPRAGACRAVTSRGDFCRNRPAEGSRFCHVHAPTSVAQPPSDVLSKVSRGIEYLMRRGRGDYVVDEFGFDAELTETLAPMFRFLVNRWFRVTTIGHEKIPAESGALLVANHAGTLPIDGAVLKSVLLDQQPHRHLRLLVADLAFGIPFLGPLIRKTGNTVAQRDDTRRLLASQELVGVFPEGFKGLGKGYSKRYHLQRFGRGGYVEMAIETKSPIIPVSIVGSEEAYPMLANLVPLSRLLGLPYFPVTPTFPLLGPLGFIPLPSKWIIEFCDPIDTSDLGESASTDPMVAFEVSDRVRHAIQQATLKNLKLRRTAFY